MCAQNPLLFPIWQEFGENMMQRIKDLSLLQCVTVLLFNGLKLETLKQTIYEYIETSPSELLQFFNLHISIIGPGNSIVKNIFIHIIMEKDHVDYISKGSLI